MKHTENYNLNKIELTDSPPDITALNPNFDKIDAELKRLTDKDTEIVASINTVKTDYLPKTGGNVTNGLTIKNKTVAVSVNGATADENGDIKINVGGNVQSINGVKPDENGDVKVEFGGGDVQSVDGVEPDENGNVQINALTQAEVLEAVQRVSDVEVDPSVAEIENLQTSVARLESEFVEQAENLTNLFNDFTTDTAPELSGALITVSATPTNDATYTYEMTTNGLVEMGCTSGTGQSKQSGGGGDNEDYWESYSSEGSTTLSVTVNGYSVYPSKTASKTSQSYSGCFFLRKGQTIKVYCKRTSNNYVIPHSFSATIYPHILKGE